MVFRTSVLLSPFCTASTAALMEPSPVIRQAKLMSQEKWMFLEDTRFTTEGNSSFVNTLLTFSPIQSPISIKWFSASWVKIFSIAQIPATSASGKLLKVPPCDTVLSSLASNLADVSINIVNMLVDLLRPAMIKRKKNLFLHNFSPSPTKAPNVKLSLNNLPMAADVRRDT